MMSWQTIVLVAVVPGAQTSVCLFLIRPRLPNEKYSNHPGQRNAYDNKYSKGRASSKFGIPSVMGCEVSRCRV